MKDGTQHSLTEALKGQNPSNPAAANTADPSGKPHPTHEQIAEDTRRQQEARPESRPDRDDKLVHTGRGQQTHG